MPYLQLALPPGILRNSTEYESKGRWYGCNQVRFVEGVILRRGDGVKHSTGAVTGKGRRIIAWRDNSYTHWVAVGTESHLYVMDDGGVPSLYLVMSAIIFRGLRRNALQGASRVSRPLSSILR